MVSKLTWLHHSIMKIVIIHIFACKVYLVQTVDGLFVVECSFFITAAWSANVGRLREFFECLQNLYFQLLTFDMIPVPTDVTEDALPGDAFLITLSTKLLWPTLAMQVRHRCEQMQIAKRKRKNTILVESVVEWWYYILYIMAIFIFLQLQLYYTTTMAKYPLWPTLPQEWKHEAIFDDVMLTQTYKLKERKKRLHVFNDDVTYRSWLKNK